MPTFHDLTTAQLRQMIQLREQIDSLEEKLRTLRGEPTTTKRKMGRPARKKRTISAAHRAALAAGQKARWAKMKGKTSRAIKPTAPIKIVAKKKKSMSPEAKAKIAAAMKARWEAKKKLTAE